ncbi:MAG: hypothetical protein IJ137_09660 [Eubacterium sp.]|nr:hypothetical protein [Eubacterium sp.]
MKKNKRIRTFRLTTLLCALCMLMTAGYGRVCGAPQAQAESQSDTKGVVRIGYAQSEEYGFFAQFLLCMAREMADEGSIRADFVEKYEDVNFEESFKEGDTLTMWNDICDANVEGARYQFTREAFFDMSKMKESEYGTMANREDVDLTFAMGTGPGVYLVKHEKKNKFMSVYAADPVASGILKSETERITPDSYAMVDYTAYQRQLEAGFKFLRFKKLGVVYEDSEEGYLIAAIPDVEKKAKELGFTTVYEHVKEPVDKADEERYYEDLKAAWRKLIDQGIDCLYITISSIDYEAHLMDLLNDAILPAGIKTLAQDDFLPLEYGVLFGVTLSDTEEIAAHIFEEIERWQKEGVPFEELDMNCESTPKIGVNYTTAGKIGFDINFEELQIVDKVFRNDR